MEGWALIIIALVIAAFLFGRRSARYSDDELRVTISTHFDEYEEDKDAWEGGFWEASEPRPLKARLQFDYTDGEGNKTSRSVVVREFDNMLYSGILLGHCEMRNANRTFRFDRIQNCVDLDTGEAISDVRTFLNEKYENSPERSVDLLVSDYLDVLKVLYFIAKADGQYRQDEKEVISSFIRELIRDERVSAAMLDGVLTEIGVPTLQAFKLAIGRVMKSGQVDPRLLEKCCKDIVATQATVHPAEEGALAYISKKRAAMGAVRN